MTTEKYLSIIAGIIIIPLLTLINRLFRLKQREDNARKRFLGLVFGLIIIIYCIQSMGI